MFVATELARKEYTGIGREPRVAKCPSGTKTAGGLQHDQVCKKIQRCIVSDEVVGSDGVRGTRFGTINGSGLNRSCERRRCCWMTR